MPTSTTRPRSYRHAYYVPVNEVKQHVQQAYRSDVDPVFLNLAKMAANNGLHHIYTGCEGVTFTRPTNAPCGYYNVLKFINKAGPVRRKNINKHFNCTIMNTIERLIAGKLVDNDFGNYSITELGKAYLAAARPAYISTRKGSQMHTAEEYAQEQMRLKHYRHRAYLMDKEYRKSRTVCA